MSLDLRILAGLALALVVAFAWLLIANADLRAELATARAGNEALRLANDQFTTAAARQNKAVAHWQALAAAHTKNITAAWKAAAKIAARYEAQAEALQEKKIAGDDCRAAQQLMDFYRGQQP